MLKSRIKLDSEYILKLELNYFIRIGSSIIFNESIILLFSKLNLLLLSI
ncbi:hypothetical protein SAMN02745118_01481 [Selenihalanaerobacter shriftii]|uniref:Uncharacterized protein n=1 Tax=Selenihalanaerobacter shriftii TaxID=142842 RepID=A0A1T4MIS9_9FIRM|nr:hypothetical protein SAMN02745118_01481 [Selenihalanaerobacter shriftii]